MTDKEIIIDDVDISGCEYCLKMTKYRCTIQRDVYKCLCEENPNCYFKQLKRKERECEKLYIQLKADEEYHKEEENTLRKIIKNKEERNIELYKENNKLKQTLTEIKEIAENVQSFVGRINIEDDVFEQMEQILQKISEMNHDL